MAEIRVKDNESLDSALRRFKRSCARSGVLAEVRKQMCIRDSFKAQLQSLGLSFDWEREINTTDPAYYRWPQWIFLQLFKHGLAYKKEMSVNWCTSCKCVLANEKW